MDTLCMHVAAVVHNTTLKWAPVEVVFECDVGSGCSKNNSESACVLWTCVLIILVHACMVQQEWYFPAVSPR